MPRGYPKVPKQKAPEELCAFKFTTFPSSIGHVNGKNVAGLFGKTDAQLWFTKRKSDAEYEQSRREKRQRLMAKDDVDTNVVDAPSSNVQISADDTGNKVLVIHPGSRWMRIGLASSENPLEVPMVIGRRKSLHSRTPCVPTGPGAQALAEGYPMSDSAALAPKIEALRAIFRSRMRAFKLRGPTGASATAAAFNSEVTPEIVQDAAPNWTDVTSLTEDFVVGEHALKLADAEKEGFELRWPILRSTFNTHGYASLQHVLDDIQDIITSILQTDFEIAMHDFDAYSVILVVPDSPDQVYLRELATLFLRNMGFKQLCIQQESVCAMLGAGLSTACVIDIGASKTTICCIEEGLIVPESRLMLNYGGDDITEFFAALLRQANFPYKELDINRIHDWHLVEGMKEQMCVLAEQEVNLGVFNVELHRPGHPLFKYQIKLYDEVLLACMCLFAPRVIDFERKAVEFANGLLPTSEQIDEVLELGPNSISTAMRNCVKHLVNAVNIQQQLAANQSLAPRPVDTESISPAPQSRAVSPNGSDYEPMDESRPNSPAPQSAKIELTSAVAPISEAGLDIKFEAGKVPLDLALIESICSTISEDRIKKFCAAVVVSGGGGRIPGVHFAVSTRLSSHVTERFPAFPPNLVNVIPNTLDDARCSAWKGIQVLHRLDVVGDVFVRSDDYERLGLKAFKDRNAFL